jgi:hypothetical protein
VETVMATYAFNALLNRASLPIIEPLKPFYIILVA